MGFGGNPWNPVKIHGNHMEILGIRWKSMESGGNQSNLMGITGNPLEIQGIQWKSMEIGWNLMEYY